MDRPDELAGLGVIVGVLQARTSSRRLPGKVLEPILGRPMLARQIERLRRVDDMQLVVATSDQASDDPVASLCEELGVGLFRGSLEDVLDRCTRAARAHAAEHVVRLTADCPLCDPALIAATIAQHLRDDNDYTSNAVERSYPDGLDVEVIRFEALARACREARAKDEREHVTLAIYRNPGRYKLGTIRDEIDRSGWRWTVDEAADLAFVRAVYEALYPANPNFGSEDIFDLLERNPKLREINT